VSQLPGFLFTVPGCEEKYFNRMSFSLAEIPAVKRMKRNNPPAGFYPKIQLNTQKTGSDCLFSEGNLFTCLVNNYKK
jgi:hypothetical protein